jgi:hypothetical protein
MGSIYLFIKKEYFIEDPLNFIRNDFSGNEKDDNDNDSKVAKVLEEDADIT